MVVGNGGGDGGGGYKEKKAPPSDETAGDIYDLDGLFACLHDFDTSRDERKTRD